MPDFMVKGLISSWHENIIEYPEFGFFSRIVEAEPEGCPAPENHASELLSGNKKTAPRVKHKPS